MNKLREIYDPINKKPIRRIDEKALEESVPQYAVNAALPRDLDPSVFTGPTMMADFDDAYYRNKPPIMTSNLGPYIVPEFCLQHKIFVATDIWMLGCAIFQILSGRDLFGIPNDPAEKVLSAMMDTLGKPPAYLLEA